MFIDSRGRSRELITMWKNTTLYFSNYRSFSSSLGTFMYSQYFGKDFSVLNICGP
jgi:hypothetical protein